MSRFYVILLTKMFGTFAHSALMISFTSKHNAVDFRISTVLVFYLCVCACVRACARARAGVEVLRPGQPFGVMP